MEYIVIPMFIVVIAVILVRTNQKSGNVNDTQQISNIVREMLSSEMATTRQEISKNTMETMREISKMILETQEKIGAQQDEKLERMIRQLDDKHKHLIESIDMMIKGIDNRMSKFSAENEIKLDNIRKTMNDNLKNIQVENSKKLDEMRNTVDEKLQKTLETRISKSFELVSKRLDEVHNGLGEMKTLASGVGDLKKVLSNVKTKGTLGEVQLEAILEQILNNEQYDKNVATIKNSAERVEFAIKLPGNGNEYIYLPIDSKFPSDKYYALREAYDSGNVDEIKNATKELVSSIKNSAKTIRDKYVEAPYTTDFAIMFLPFEGLYSEVVNLGLIEQLQNDYKINIAGPTTMAALLNSLQMGFRTLAIQKRSSQVWEVLGSVKSEFQKFEDVLGKAQDKIGQANKEIETLIGTRTRAINRKLRDVEMIESKDSQIPITLV